LAGVTQDIVLDREVLVGVETEQALGRRDLVGA
jgi:hypothetical protein